MDINIYPLTMECYAPLSIIIWKGRNIKWQYYYYLLLSFSTLKMHMTPLRNMALWKIYMIWPSGDVKTFSFKTFYLRGNFESEWGHPSLTFMIKKWEFPRGAIYLSPFLLSKSTASPKCLRNGVDKSLFYDDIGVSYRSNHMHAIER